VAPPLLGNTAQHNQYAGAGASSQANQYRQLMPATQGTQANHHRQLMPTAQVAQPNDNRQLVRTVKPPEQQGTQNPNPGQQSAQCINYLQLMNASTTKDLPTNQQQSGNNDTVKISVTNTTTNNEIYGGKARKAAARKGTAELKRFDTSVEKKLRKYSAALCPDGYHYYVHIFGYLCGGGSHFVTHEDVDCMELYSKRPRVQIVNAPRNYLIIIPPWDGWHEPMHWAPVQRIAHGLHPMPVKRDGKKHDLGAYWEWEFFGNGAWGAAHSLHHSDFGRQVDVGGRR
jgi:hypothetical protein